MSRAVQFVVRVGDGVDALAAAVRATPGRLRAALSVRRYRRLAVVIGLAYLVVYLVAIQDISISLDGKYGRIAGAPAVEVVPEWSERLFAERAPFLYEPVAAVYPLPQLALLVSPGNVLVGSLLGALLGAGIALAAYAGARERACRRRRYAGALGALPALLMGFSCCAPSFFLLLGTNFAAAVLPAFIPVRSYLLPLAVATMALMLVWSGRKATLAERALAGA